MSSFLKLNNFVVNTHYITSIHIYKNLYRINLISNHSGFVIFGNGSFHPHKEVLEFSKEKDEESYNKITNWMNNDCK
jgi:hypothetical protein